MKAGRGVLQPTLEGFEPAEAPRVLGRARRVGARAEEGRPDEGRTAGASNSARVAARPDAVSSPNAARSPNSDLVGRTFYDGTSHVVVKGLSASNPAHVVVEREHDGHTWTIHAGVVRLIVGRAPRRRAA